jgi:hypothetical protein
MPVMMKESEYLEEEWGRLVEGWVIDWWEIEGSGCVWRRRRRKRRWWVQLLLQLWFEVRVKPYWRLIRGTLEGIEQDWIEWWRVKE